MVWCSPRLHRVSSLLLHWVSMKEAFLCHRVQSFERKPNRTLLTADMQIWMGTTGIRFCMEPSPTPSRSQSLRSGCTGLTGTLKPLRRPTGLQERTDRCCAIPHTDPWISMSCTLWGNNKVRLKWWKGCIWWEQKPLAAAAWNIWQNCSSCRFLTMQGQQWRMLPPVSDCAWWAVLQLFLPRLFCVVPGWPHLHCQLQHKSVPMWCNWWSLHLLTVEMRWGGRL